MRMCVCVCVCVGPLFARYEPEVAISGHKGSGPRRPIDPSSISRDRGTVLSRRRLPAKRRLSC